MTFDFLRPHRVDSKIRIGRVWDGGYVLEDKSLDSIDVLYTYGVGWEVSFERDLFKRTKKPSRIFDPTMFDVGNIRTLGKKSSYLLFKFFAKIVVWTLYVPFIRLRYKISFYNEGLGLSKRYKYDSFPNHLKRFGDEGKKIFLKIDIEGGEYEVFNNKEFLKALENVVQIAIEFHDADSRFTELKSIVEMLNKNFTIVHFHGNNYGGVFELNGKKIPRAIELTFLNNDFIKSKQADLSPMPIPHMDYPNSRALPDINISEIFA